MKQMIWTLLFFLIVGVLLYCFITETKPTNKSILKKPIKKKPLTEFEAAEQNLHYGNPETGIEILERLAQNKEHATKASHTLAKLYHNGIPDRVIPHHEKAIYWYSKYNELANDVEALLAIADIYHWGVNQTGIDLKKCKALYFQIIHNNHIDDYHRGLARDRLRQLNEELGLSPEDGIPITSPMFNYTYTTLEDTMGSTPVHIKNGIEPVKIESDGNNVHDHIVFNTVKKSIDKLRKETDMMYKLPEATQQIKRHIMECQLNQGTKSKALQVFNYMIQENQQRPSTSNEVDLLLLVWNRIHNNVNRNNVASLKDNLVKQLADCIEFDKFVCPKGRYDHILDTLTGIDPVVNISPKWAVIKEMMSKACLIRDKYLAGLHPNDRHVLEVADPEPEEQLKYHHLFNNLKTLILEDFTKSYVETGIMNEDLLNTEVGKWINDIV